MNEVGKLLDYCTSIIDGTHSTVQDDLNGSYYLLSAKNIKNGTVQYDESDRHISSQTFFELRKRTHIDYHDVLLTTVGSIGQVSVVKELDYEFQRSVAIIKTEKSKLNPLFLKYILNTEQYQHLIENYVCGSVQKCLFLEQIKSIPINPPEIRIQEIVVGLLDPLDRYIDNLSKINDNLGGGALAS